MAALPTCEELRRSVNSSDWEPQFILRCRREISEIMEDCEKRGLFVGFSFVVPSASLILIGSAAVVGLVGGVAVFQEEEDAVC
ncbi:hypothetical protein Tco_1259210 [Tanacetum coccineum]